MVATQSATPVQLGIRSTCHTKNLQLKVAPKTPYPIPKWSANNKAECPRHAPAAVPMLAPRIPWVRMDACGNAMRRHHKRTRTFPEVLYPLLPKDSSAYLLLANALFFLLV